MVKGINVIYIVFDIKLYYNDIFIFILKSNRHYTVQLFSFYQINIRWSSFNVTLVVKLSLLNWKNKQHNNNIYSFSFHKLNKPFNTKTINSFYTYWFILRHFDNSFLTRLFFFIFFLEMYTQIKQYTYIELQYMLDWITNAFIIYFTLTLNWSSNSSPNIINVFTILR